MEAMTQVHFQDKKVFTFTNTHEKGMNPSLLPLAMGK